MPVPACRRRFRLVSRPRGPNDFGALLTVGPGRDAVPPARAGPGPNDAPALRRADIEVATGRRHRGGPAGRRAGDGFEAADGADSPPLLVDHNLATVADEIGGGRRVYDNI